MDKVAFFALLFIGLLAVVCVIVGWMEFTEFRESRIARKPTCTVYLLRISDGKAEIKKAPKQDMWNWRF